MLLILDGIEGTRSLLLLLLSIPGAAGTKPATQAAEVSFRKVNKINAVLKQPKLTCIWHLPVKRPWEESQTEQIPHHTTVDKRSFCHHPQ